MRTGTAKLIEVCWLLLNDSDFEKARTVDSMDRHLFLETLDNPLIKSEIEPPIVAKTHVHFPAAKKLVESNRKVILGLRNPKDALVSYYHFNRMNKMQGSFPGNWGQFFELYKQGKFPYGDYFENVLSWWEEKDRGNILAVMYEDLVQNAEETIKKIAQFLSKQCSDDEIQKIADWTSFANIRNQPSSNFTRGISAEVLDSSISPYMRKGIAGDWKNYFREDENAYIDDLCERLAKPKGLFFKFE